MLWQRLLSINAMKDITYSLARFMIVTLSTSCVMVNCGYATQIKVGTADYPSTTATYPSAVAVSPCVTAAYPSILASTPYIQATYPSIPAAYPYTEANYPYAEANYPYSLANYQSQRATIICQLASDNLKMRLPSSGVDGVIILPLRDPATSCTSSQSRRVSTSVECDGRFVFVEPRFRKSDEGLIETIQITTNSGLVISVDIENLGENVNALQLSPKIVIQ